MGEGTGEGLINTVKESKLAYAVGGLLAGIVGATKLPQAVRYVTNGYMERQKDMIKDAVREAGYAGTGLSEDSVKDLVSALRENTEMYKSVLEKYKGE